MILHTCTKATHDSHVIHALQKLGGYYSCVMFDIGILNKIIVLAAVSQCGNVVVNCNYTVVFTSCN